METTEFAESSERKNMTNKRTYHPVRSKLGDMGSADKT
jgi:hypothetical protein